MRALFAIKGFLLFSLIAFLNAFVDLGHKILIQNTIFKTYDGDVQIMLSALVNALILLPFILMMTPSSFLADKYPKNKVMQYSALSAVVATVLITIFYYMAWFWAAFLMTLALSMQSAIYSPAKYGYIRELVGVKKLASGNGVIQSVTTTAILLGTLAFSFGFESLLSKHYYYQAEDILPLIAPLGWVLVALSLIECVAALKLEPKSSVRKEQEFDTKAYLSGRSAVGIMKDLTSNQVIFRSVIGLAVFWSLCQVMLATFPAFAKDIAGIDNTVIIQGTMAFAGIGIVIGAFLAGKLSSNYIETGLVPLGAMGVALSVAFVSFAITPFLQAVNFFLLGVFGGLYLVPLNALIQYHAKSGQMGRILAGNNFVQNIAMLTFLLLTILAAYAGMNSLGIFAILLAVAIIGAIYTITQLPQSLARLVVSLVFSLRYRLTVLNMERIPASGGVLMLGNHISWIDWAIVQMASPRPLRFVMAKSIYERWYLRFIFEFFNIIPVGTGASKQALDAVRESLNKGEVVCLFPEGAISRNGHLGEFQRGFEVAAADADAVIVPFYLRGLWGSRFSRSSDRLKTLRSKQSFSDLIVAFGEPLAINSDRFAVKQAVLQLSVDAWTNYTESLETLPEAIIKGLKRQGSEMAAADIIGSATSGHRMLSAAILFSKQIPGDCHQNIGILMPSSSAGVIANIASLLSGKTLVNLNFTASVEALAAASKKADINTIITSRKFIEKLANKGFDASLLDTAKHVLYMEDLRQNIKKRDFISMMVFVRLMPMEVIKARYMKAVKAEDPAVILFSSGSEGTPKGVLLSHRNVMSNIKQIADVINTERDDVVMSVLPLFHAFGLTVTTFLPLVESLPVICHPDPTDVRNIAKGIATFRGTILCGTSTFLRMYVCNRKVEPLMLDSLRIVVSGAEKLNPEVRDSFKIKFNKTIYEGYGATETTPVASVNIPDKLAPDTLTTQIGSKLSTVGMPLPGTRFRIVNPDTFEDLPAGEDGLILIGGNQVMIAYLDDPEKTESVITEQDGVRWYHTGDKGHLDEDGFLVIVDRYSRFAKVGGEMISLGAIESALKPHLSEEVDILATTVADEKKGEKVVLLYTQEQAEADIKQTISEHLSPLMQPSKLLYVEDIPKLGTGKTDLNAAKKLAAQAIQ